MVSLHADANVFADGVVGVRRKQRQHPSAARQLKRIKNLRALGTRPLHHLGLERAVRVGTMSSGRSSTSMRQPQS